MINQENNLLAKYSKETHYSWTLGRLIEDHRNLVAQQIEVEIEGQKAEARGFREGHAYGLRSVELLNKLTQKNELEKL
jgi:hypothetical protein